MTLLHGAVKSWARLSDFTFTFHFHALEKEMATHSSVLAWRIPGTEEPGGLPSIWVAQSQTWLKRLSSSSSSLPCMDDLVRDTRPCMADTEKSTPPPSNWMFWKATPTVGGNPTLVWAKCSSPMGYSISGPNLYKAALPRNLFFFLSVSGFLVPGASLIQFLPEISYQWLRCWRGSDIKPDVDFKQSTCFSLLPHCYPLWPLVSTIPELLLYLLLLFIFLYSYLSLTFCFAKLLSTDIFVTWSYTYLLVQRRRSLCFYFLFSLL